jgi:Rps23 Pro-64 3,4-dihydroxylase Tpa1-like proline 4-hydroxylase
VCQNEEDGVINNLVNQAVLDNSAALCRQFASARPFRHIAIDDFLEGGFARSLLENFPAFDESLAINENGEAGGKAVHENIAGLAPVWQKLDKLVAGKEFREMVSALTGIGALQFDPHYFGGGTHENLHGQSLNPHVDFNFHPKTRQHRRLNLILYLSPEWDPAWGGSIQLHRDPYQRPADDEIVTITPAFNRCVIFETNEYSWHGFKRINLPADKRHISRKSFALYYYTDSRPAEEVGAEHSTIYVEEHLPGHFEAGMTLAAEDLQHINNLLASRDRHLKRLYADVKHLNTELNILRVALGIDEPLGSIEPGENDSVEFVIMKKQVAYLQQRIREFENSSSWRITRPLRALRRVLSGKTGSR